MLTRAKEANVVIDKSIAGTRRRKALSRSTACSASARRHDECTRRLEELVVNGALETVLSSSIDSPTLKVDYGTI